MDNFMTDYDDIIDVLNRPLWCGHDAEFAGYIHRTFDVPASLDLVSITPRGTKRRAAIAIDGPIGALVLVLSWPMHRKLKIQPIVLGPLHEDTAVIAGVRRFSAELHSPALTQLVVRHLPMSAVDDLLAPTFH